MTASRLVHPVLRRPIPAGYPGRTLSRLEVDRLRRLGFHLSERWHVVRTCSESDDNGLLYYPAKGGGLNSGGIRVEAAGRQRAGKTKNRGPAGAKK